MRTARRLATTTDIGSENREKLRRVFGCRSIILWAIRSHSPLRKEYEITIAALRSSAPYIVRHRSPEETNVWLSRMRGAVPDVCGDSRKGACGISW